MLLTKAKVRKAIKRLDVNIMFAILPAIPAKYSVYGFIIIILTEF